MNSNKLQSKKSASLLYKVAKGVGYSVGILFIILFVYANTSKPSLGEKAYMERPTQLAVLTLPNQFSQQDSLSTMQYLLQNKAVYNASITMYSKTLAITVDAKHISRDEIIKKVQSFNPAIKERVMASTRPECPVAGPLHNLHQIKYALCIRQ